MEPDVSSLVTKCPNKDLCGSCGWSDLNYEDQLKRKLMEINLAFGSSICTEIIPSPKISHYRNKMDFVIDYQGKVGLREKGKWWRVLDGHTCFLADEKIEEVFHKARNFINSCGLTYYDRKSHEGLLRYLVLRFTTQLELMLTLVTSLPKNSQEEQFLLERVQELNILIRPTSLIWSINSTMGDTSFGTELKVIAGKPTIMEEINGYKYLISPNAFFQTNSATAALLQDVVLSYILSLPDVDRVVDLYCGTGFFTIPLATLKEGVVGVELVEEAVSDAQENARANNVEVDFFVNKSEDFDWKTYLPDLLLVDPPRSGLHPKLIAQIKVNRPKYLVYVSCNYKNFVRDLNLLKEEYVLVNCKAVDMFPQTEHVELVSLLKLL